MPQNLSTQIVCPSPKVCNFDGLRWASLGVRSPWKVSVDFLFRHLTCECNSGLLFHLQLRRKIKRAWCEIFQTSGFQGTYMRKFVKRYGGYVENLLVHLVFKGKISLSYIRLNLQSLRTRRKSNLLVKYTVLKRAIALNISLRLNGRISPNVKGTFLTQRIQFQNKCVKARLSACLFAKFLDTVIRVYVQTASVNNCRH